VYSEKMAREMLPGLIRPLIWSVNIPLVNGAWVRILTELIGKNRLDPRSLARQFLLSRLLQHERLWGDFLAARHAAGKPGSY